MKREFKVGDRVAVKENGYIVGRGTLTEISKTATGPSCRVRTDQGGIYSCYLENLRYLRPKPKRDAKILEDALDHMAGEKEDLRQCCRDLAHFFPNAEDMLAHFKFVAKEALQKYRGAE